MDGNSDSTAISSAGSWHGCFYCNRWAVGMVKCNNVNCHKRNRLCEAHYETHFFCPACRDSDFDFSVSFSTPPPTISSMTSDTISISEEDVLIALIERTQAVIPGIPLIIGRGFQLLGLGGKHYFKIGRVFFRISTSATKFIIIRCLVCLSNASKRASCIGNLESLVKKCSVTSGPAMHMKHKEEDLINLATKFYMSKLLILLSAFMKLSTNVFHDFSFTFHVNTACVYFFVVLSITKVMFDSSFQSAYLKK